MDSYSDKKLINVVRNEKRNGVEKITCGKS